MSLLLDELPESVWINDVEYPINADFRTSIKYQTLMTDNSIPGNEKVIEALMLYYGGIPADANTAIEAMIAFYHCGIEPKKSQESDKKPTYSFEYDAPYIYAAFMQQYHIDLVDVGFLHWWKFKAMFDALMDMTEFIKIVQYRCAKPYPNMPKEEKRHLEKMKRIYALPREGDRELSELEEALRNGGDISNILSK